MNIDDVVKLINILPNIVIYVAPGFIFIQVFNYIMDIRGKDLKNSIMEYILSSYIIIAIIKFICNKFHYEVNIYENTIQVTICVITILLSYIIAILLKSQIWTTFMRFIIVNKSNSTNIFHDIIDSNLGTWVRVYIPSEKLIYDGAFIKFDYKGSYQDSFIVLSNYCTYRYGDGNIDEDILNDNPSPLEHVAIKVSEISRIEATYAAKSKKVLKCSDTNILTLLSKIKEKTNKKNKNQQSTLEV